MRVLVWVLFALAVFLTVTATTSTAGDIVIVEEPESKCPLAGRCPYVDKLKKQHKKKALKMGNKGGTGCPLQAGKCPYFDMHKSDNGWMDSLKEKTHHCPLEAKCPFYQKMKEGKMEDIDWTATNCPMAEGCPYYKKFKDSPSHLNCPVLKGCPHFKKDEAVDSDQVISHKCPLTGKCPWYSKSKKETSGGDDTTKTECPLHKSGCPYYERHKKDHSVNDVLQEPDHQCVLTEKCTFYKALKDGKLNTVDWTTSNCPLKDKCPYYETVKNDPKRHINCPILHSCPYFNKNGLGDHHHGHSHTYQNSAHDRSCPMKSGCPYYQQYLDSSHGSGEPCPLGNKCPYYSKFKEGKTSDIDLSQTNCPLAEKCPYYKKIKSGEIKLADAVDGCPYLNSRSSASHHGTAGGDASECPFMKKKAKDAADKDKMKAHDEL